ncbi:MAG: hypothetical protein ACJ763_02685 [Bdellovibrionia bacterium]
MDITQIYSGADYFGVPLQPYMAAYIFMMIMYLGPTLIALAWALTIGQGNRTALRLVRPLERVGERVGLIGLEREREVDREIDRESDRAA